MDSAARGKGLIFPSVVTDWLIHADTPVVITGGSGWLGQATLEMLDNALGDAIVERVHVFGSTDRILSLRSGRPILCRRLDSLSELVCKPPLFLHYAFLTREKVANFGFDTFVRLNLGIADRVAAAIARLQPIAVFLPSSGAVYRPDRSLDDEISHNPYGVLKVRDEKRFTLLCHGFGIPLTIMRIFNLAGPFINKVHSYALSSIIMDVLANRPITIRARAQVIRSFIHVGDLIAVAVAAGINDRRRAPPRVLDGCGSETIEIGDLGRRIAAVLGRPNLRIERPHPSAGDRPDRYLGDPTALAILADRLNIPLRDLSYQIRETADFLEG